MRFSAEVAIPRWTRSARVDPGERNAVESSPRRGVVWSLKARPACGDLSARVARSSA